MILIDLINKSYIAYAMYIIYFTVSFIDLLVT